MLLTTKLFTVLHFSGLQLPILKTALAAGLAVLAWDATDMTNLLPVGDADHVTQRQAETTTSPLQFMWLHNEILNISDKFLVEQQQLDRQPSETVVETF